jgi:MoaA/NifB/PqqE/SkfB family radical SAM enzyme
MHFPPRFLFLTINKACNLRCGHCAYWTTDDADRAHYMSPALRRGLMTEFARLNPSGAVVICGGESMLAANDYYDVSRTCRDLGLTCLSVVNGTLVQSARVADRMIAEGPHEITVSLNSHRAELHDRTRGLPGAFGRAVAALRLLLDARGRSPGSGTRVYVMALVFDENYLDLESFYDFVLNDIGADKLKLNLLQPSFGGPADDLFFREHHVMDPDALAAVLDRCDRRFGLQFNPAWVDAVVSYARTLSAITDAGRGWETSAQTAEGICNSCDRNVMVDPYGMARLCFSTRFPGRLLRRPGDLTRFWLGADRIRRGMRECRQLCGISHSVRRESATRTPAPFALRPPPLPVEPVMSRLVRVALSVRPW